MHGEAVYRPHGLGSEMYIGGGFLGTILVVLLIIYVAKRV
jgi:hypothetical protein